MSTSTVTTTSTDTNNSDKNTYENSTVVMDLESTFDSVLGNKMMPATPSKPQFPPTVLPLVYIQTPTTILSQITTHKTNTNNVIVNTVTPFQFGNKAQNNQIFGNSVKAPQLIIQKHPGNVQTVPVVPVSNSYGNKIGAILTMVKQVPKGDCPNRVQLASVNKLKPPESVHVITNGTATSTAYTPNQKYLFTPMPKVTSNRLPVTATTNVVQSKIAFMPISLPATVNNNVGPKQKVFNFKISDGQLQNDNAMNITIMNDNSNEEDEELECEEGPKDELICDEIIDLDSPNKTADDKSYELSIVEDSEQGNDIIEISVQEGTEKKGTDKPKFQNKGISILKRSFNFPIRNIDKPSNLIISPVPNSITTISDTNTKEVKISSNIEDEKIAPQKTERRRKSNISYRKDYDDVQVTWGVNKEQFESADITFTECGDEHPVKDEKPTQEDMIEIKLVEEKSGFKDDYDVSKVLYWEDGIGTLPASSLKFKINEFGILEYLTNDEYKNANSFREKEIKLLKKENSQEEVRCKNCGCYGIISDFINPRYCSFDCKESVKKAAKDREIKLKRKKKKLLKKSDSCCDEKECDQSEEGNSSNENSHDKFPYPWTCSKKGFSWAKYLDHMKAKSAPVKLWKDPFPYNRNCFRPAMKLEGIDPYHPSYYCVLTVAEVIGYRLRLHFDGYPENYDFWVNADSMDIFPAGWCEKYKHTLHPPSGYTVESFNWASYLRQTKSTMAPKHLFFNRSGSSICPNGFRTGMKLEAVDKKNTSLVCVATVMDTMDNRILVHFDSWDNIYDYWADPTSLYIHPVGWCDQYGHNLTPPNDYPDPASFTWEKYLEETQSTAAPVRAFKQRPPCGFKKGMRLECVDRRVPQLIRVATVSDVRDHQIRISFDGWPLRYSYWVDEDSPDIHPVGWCQKTGHPIEPPLTPNDVYDFLDCVTVGCKGQGHIRGPKYPTHSNQKYCPYAEENIDRERILPDRLVSPDRQLEAVVPVSREPKDKPKPRLGRPPKIPRLEPAKTEWPDDDSGSERKPKRKYVKRVKSESPPYGAKAALIANGFTPVPSLAEQEVWVKHSKYLMDFVKKDMDPREWDETDVSNFVSSLPSCEDHGELFSENKIDGDSFLMLTQSDLVDILNMKLGPAIKLYNSIVLLRRNINNEHLFT